MNNLPLRPNVCILLFNQEKKLLLGERSRSPGVWQFPQGGVEFDRSIEGNVLREIEEELGIPADAVEIVGALKARHQYDFDPVPDYAEGIWRGQDQTFWIVRFIGKDEQINVATEHPEFTAWGWFSEPEVRQKAEQKRMSGYDKALREFVEILPSL